MNYRAGFNYAVLLSLTLCAPAVYAAHEETDNCEKPMFSEFKPSPNKYNQSFTDFSFLASGNTTSDTLSVDVTVGKSKFHFSAKDLTISLRSTGQLAVKGRLLRPVEHGFARVNMTAESVPGCVKSDGYFVRVH
jgi:hypothetical protein